MTNNESAWTYAEISELRESLDSSEEAVHRDSDLEQMAKYSVPSDLSKHVKVMYTDDMDKNNLRLIKLQNHEGHIEYHIHNQSVMFGKSGNESKLGFISTLKLIHNDGAAELASGKKIVLQTLPGSPQHAKFHFIANRLAAKAGKTVRDGGIKPFTSNPHVQGPTIVIE